MNGVFKKIIDRANGKRGERPVEIPPNRDLLTGFNLHMEVSFDSIFQAPYTASANFNRSEVKLSIPDFDSSKLIHAPSGASHFRLMNAIVVLPNFVYSPISKQYSRSDGMTELLKADSSSDYIPLNGMIGSDIIQTAVLPFPAINTSDKGIVCLIGIQFYQDVNGEKYLLKEGNCMMICGIF